jgi:hypothetical protein
MPLTVYDARSIGARTVPGRDTRGVERVDRFPSAAEARALVIGILAEQQSYCDLARRSAPFVRLESVAVPGQRIVRHSVSDE